MAKVTPSSRSERATVNVKTKKDADKQPQAYNWWKGKSKDERGRQLVETVAFLKEQQQFRFRQASIHARMYGNLPLANFAGSVTNKMSQPQNLPSDRPTMNVIQSCVDTLTARISQAKPKPLFLTDGGDYKARYLSKKMNNFIAGELYQTEAHKLGPTALKDGSIIGTGAIKVMERDDKVALERVLVTEILVDNNDAFYGNPRSMYQIKLVDRSVLKDMLPEERSKIDQAEQAYPDNSGDSQKTMSDQIMICEGWHLPSGKDAGDGRHTIACTSGTITDEVYEKDNFPFVFFHFSPRLVGLWAQGLAEQLTGTQVEINKLLVTISQSISLVGVPRVFVEDGSKVVKAHLNNNVGSIVTYRGTKPEYEVAPCVPQELYAQLQRLIEYAYQQSGISALGAAGQKPQGLDSGEAIRTYDDLQTDRFSVIETAYHEMYIELAYKIVDKACDIAKRTGKYQTVYPNKDGTKEIDLPDVEELLKNPFEIRCYDSNALPKDPAGRKQAIIEDMQAGLLTPQEGRRLLNYSDLEQDDKLAVAGEERILKILDEIVEEGKYTPPDPYIDIQLAKQRVVQVYNLYAAANLEESKLEKLRTWQTQLLALEAEAMAPMQAAMAAGAPASQGATQATPQAQPQSDLMSQVPSGPPQ